MTQNDEQVEDKWMTLQPKEKGLGLQKRNLVSDAHL
jgi:hypothetical protein